LALGHNYIGTEHLLLGLVSQSEGGAAQVLSNLGADPVKVRRAVVRRLGGHRSQRRRGDERGPRDHRPGEPLTTPREARTGPVRILIADDHARVRDRLRSLVDDEAGLEVVGEAANGREAVEQCRSLKPDLVLMDVRMPEMDGLEATRAIEQESPSISILLMVAADSMHENPDYLRQALRAGARGFVHAGMHPRQIAHALRVASWGEMVIPRELLEELGRRPPAGPTG
jgi:CheY-like chemotaxis protein